MNSVGEWARTGTGTTTADGFTDWSYAGSGVYSYAGPGYSGSGTVLESGGQGTSYDFTAGYIFLPISGPEVTPEGGTWASAAGGGSRTADGNTHWTYLGAGSYTYAASGATITGATTESGGDHTGFIFTTTTTLDALGQSTTTGTGDTSADGGDTFTYVGAGPYSYTAGGATVLGTITENGSDTTLYDFGTTSTLDAAGDWTTTGGGGTTLVGASAWSYFGAGTYSHSTLHSSVSGNVVESGSDGVMYQATTTSNLDAAGDWSTTGTASSQTLGATIWAYQGVGNYDYLIAGGSVSGTTIESGNDATSYLYATTSTLDPLNGEWDTVGSGGSLSGGTTMFNYIGAGSYSYDTTGGSVSGLITENGTDNSLYSFSFNTNLADGVWTTFGNGASNTIGTNQSTYQGAGDYAYPTTGGSVDGTISEHGLESGNSSTSVNSVLNDGVWTSLGNASNNGQSQSFWSYEGDGDYSYDTRGGGVDGTIQEHGLETGFSTYATTSALAAGEWTSHGGSTHSTEGNSDWSYEGDGNYGYFTLGGYVSGTIDESGEENDAYNSTINSALTAGVWSSTGTGGGHGDAVSDWSYDGAGNYVTTLPDGQLIGTIGEGGHTHDESTYNTTSTLAHDVWTTTGTGTVAGDEATDSSFDGHGDYFRTDGLTFAVDGTVDESGHDNTTGDYTGASTLAAGAWTTLRSGTDTADTARDWSYDGTGTHSGTFPRNDGFLHTINSTFDESGGRGTSVQVNETWSETPAGRASITVRDTQSDSAGSYDFAADGVFDWHDAGYYGMFDVNYTKDMGGDFSTWSNTQTIIDRTAEGTVTSSGSGAGGHDSSGSSDYHGDGLHTYRALIGPDFWNVFAEDIHDEYDFQSSWWTNDAVDGVHTEGDSHTGTASGSWEREAAAEYPILLDMHQYRGTEVFDHVFESYATSDAGEGFGSGNYSGQDADGDHWVNFWHPNLDPGAGGAFSGFDMGPGFAPGPAGPNGPEVEPPVYSPPPDPPPEPEPDPEPVPDPDPEPEPEPDPEPDPEPEPPPAPPTAPPPRTMTGRAPTTWDFITSSFAGYGGNVGGTLKGYFWNGPKNMVVGVGTAALNNIMHPIDSGLALVSAISHPIVTGQAIYDDIVEKTQTSEGQGELGFEIATTVLTFGQAGAANATAKSARLASAVDKASDAARLVDKAGDTSRVLGEMRTGGQWRWGYQKLANSDAAAAYQAIRESTTDVAAIGRYTGYNPTRLQRIKDYLFKNPEWTGADAEIAAAWHRLRTGRGTEVDRLLLKHETAEMFLRQRYGLDYLDAHRRANRNWNWERAIGE